METGTRSTFWVRAVGVYFAEGRLTITTTALPPFGKRAVAPTSVSVEDAGPGKALAAWVESHLTPRQRRRVPVCIGLGAEQTFFTSRTVEAPPEQAPTSEALLSMVGASWISVTDAVADGVRVRLGGATAFSIAACRRELAMDFLQNLRQCGVRNIRLMPAPWAALALAGSKGRPRGWKVFVQVVLARPGGLAILVAQGHPVLWRRFASAGQDVTALISAIRHLQVHAKQNLRIREIAGIALLGQLTQGQIEQLNQETGLTVVARDDRHFDESEYSRAMAQWGHGEQHDSLDLLRSLRLPLTLREMFPRKLAVLMALAIAGMGLFLQNMLWGLQADYRSLKRQNASYEWASRLRMGQIEGQRKHLKAEVKAVQQFLGTRVIWSNYLRDLPTRLPRNACLTNIHGAFELQDASKKQQRRVNRSLMLRGMAQFADRGSAPKEIDAFLESLREMALLKKDFPLVNLAEIKWRKEAFQDIALFTVLAMPLEKSKPGSPKEDSGESGH